MAAGFQAATGRQAATGHAAGNFPLHRYCYSNIRLESYLFTEQAFDDIKRVLKPGGVFVTYNFFRQGWVVERVAAMAKSDVISWGAFGVVYGAIVGAVNNGGILSFIKGGVATGLAWAIFGLVAGALYGLWAGRAVSARRLKGIGPLLAPDTSTMLAWANGDITPQTVTELAAPDAQSLILRFNPAGRGAVLEV